MKTQKGPLPERPRRACWSLASGWETRVLAPVWDER